MTIFNLLMTQYSTILYTLDERPQKTDFIFFPYKEVFILHLLTLNVIVYTTEARK